MALGLPCGGSTRKADRSGFGATRRLGEPPDAGHNRADYLAG